jgi:hypothetical protein
MTLKKYVPLCDQRAEHQRWQWTNDPTQYDLFGVGKIHKDIAGLGPEAVEAAEALMLDVTLHFREGYRDLLIRPDWGEPGGEQRDNVLVRVRTAEKDLIASVSLWSPVEDVTIAV